MKRPIWKWSKAGCGSEGARVARSTRRALHIAATLFRFSLEAHLAYVGKSLWCGNEPCRKG
jgi:hypothetical protein